MLADNSEIIYTKPPKKIMRSVGRAIADYNMIKDGDRILLGLSGGKDSLALLLVLHHLSSYAPIKFELAAATVDPQIVGFNPESMAKSAKMNEDRGAVIIDINMGCPVKKLISNIVKVQKYKNKMIISGFLPKFHCPMLLMRGGSPHARPSLSVGFGIRRSCLSGSSWRRR